MCDIVLILSVYYISMHGGGRGIWAENKSPELMRSYREAPILQYQITMVHLSSKGKDYPVLQRPLYYMLLYIWDIFAPLQGLCRSDLENMGSICAYMY